MIGVVGRVAAVCCFIGVVAGLASEGYAQKSKLDIVKIERIDETVFNESNQKRLCKDEGGRRVVDKAKLEALFLLAFDERQGSLALTAWLSDSTNKLYEVYSGTPPKERPTAPEFFSGPEYQIVCKTRKREENEDSAGGNLAKIAKNIIVRKGVSDIKVKTDDITKVNAATLSFAKDDVAHTTTVAAEGLVGVVIAGTGADKGLAPRDATDPFYWYSITPYVFHKRFDLEPDSKSKKDVNYVMPGISGNVIVVTPDRRTSLAIQLDASSVFDAEQDAHYSMATLRLSPGFTIGEQPFLRAPLPLASYLTLYPEIAFVAQQFLIHDPGANKDLLDKTSFTGIGFDASAQLYWTDASSILSGFTLKGAYKYRQNFGLVPDVNRVSAGIAYSPASSKNITIELEYVNGRDENTLQQEERWGASLGIRY
jgi:hypothetical protein